MLLLLASAAAFALGPGLETAGAPVVLGPREATQIQQVVAERLEILRSCVVGTPPLGHLTVRLSIGASGEVDATEILQAPPATEGLASCVATQLARVSLPAADSPTVADLSFALLPSQLIVPRTRLLERMQACGRPGARAILAAVQVDRGFASQVELHGLAQVDAGVAACVKTALEIGPHRMGTGPRVYAWTLRGASPGP